MEEVSCGLCGSSARAVVHEVQDRLHGLDGKFKLVRCCDCGLLYLSPRPDRTEISHYYPADYEPYSGVRKLPLLRRLDTAFGTGKRCRAVTQRKACGRILDIGCASGRFLSSMRSLGWETYGVEVSEYAALLATEELGLNVFCGAVEGAHFGDDSFDVVTFWDVIEHLHDPKETLREINRILKRDGLLIVNTPDISSLDARLFGGYWAGLDAPRHLFLFSPQTLGFLLKEVGFTVLGRKYFTGNHYTFVQSLRFLIEGNATNPTYRAVGSALTEWHLLRVALLPYFIAINRFMKGPVMTVFARRSGA